VTDLHALRDAFLARGLAVIDDHNLTGVDRFYAEDPWGNRLEFQQRRA
jgi:hypothetical protein